MGQAMAMQSKTSYPHARCSCHMAPKLVAMSAQSSPAAGAESPGSTVPGEVIVSSPEHLALLVVDSSPEPAASSSRPEPPQVPPLSWPGPVLPVLEAPPTLLQADFNSWLQWNSAWTSLSESESEEEAIREEWPERSPRTPRGADGRTPRLPPPPHGLPTPR